MDIRKYFGSQTGSPKKSSLSELRKAQDTPMGKKTRPKRTVANTFNFEKVISNSDSDGEEPVPRSIRNELNTKSKHKRIVISSDDDDFVHSVSTIQPRKRSERIIVDVPASNSQKTLEAATKGKLSNKRKVSSSSKSEEGDSKDDTTEDEDLFVNRKPAKRGKFAKRESNQSVLPLKKISRQTDKPKDVRKVKNCGDLKKIDEVEFFDTFGEFPKHAQKKQPNIIEESSQGIPRKRARKEVSSSEGQEKKSTSNLRKKNESCSSKTSPVTKAKKEADRKESVRSSEVKPMSSRKLNASRGETSVISKHSSTEKKLTKKICNEIESPEKKLKTKKSVQDDEKNLPWVDKYRPNCLGDLVAQNGEKSPMNKLLAWLRNWYRLHLGECAHQKKPRPPPWMSQSDGSSFKAVLLSGVPGVGKTSCALLACKELNLHFVEMNASEVRNKKVLEAKVAELTGCHQIEEFFKEGVKKRELTHVLIMDEVDGMSGNEDRAGLAELIQMIKSTRIPIICICNDRQSPKMRTLINYCYDIRFQRPRVEQIRARLLTILGGEKLKFPTEELDKLIEAANHDVRQSIYGLQLLSYETGGAFQPKDCAVNAFEAARRLLSPKTSLSEKQQMFFTDYMLMPLFVQENYLNIQSSGMSKAERLSTIRRAAHSISLGDVVEKSIRTYGNWNLLNTQCMLSSVLPPAYMQGHLKAMINFPSLLGKISTTNKRSRLLQQVSTHCYSRIPTSSTAMLLDYIPYLREKLFYPLVEQENDGVSAVLDVYKEYDFVKSDAEAISELSVWPNIKNPVVKVLPKVKAALTRALNKECRLLPYASDEIFKKRRKAKESELQMDEEGNLVEVADDEGAASSDDDDDEDIPVAVGSKEKATKTSSSRGGRGGRNARGNAPTRGRRGGKK